MECLQTVWFKHNSYPNLLISSYFIFYQIFIFSFPDALTSELRPFFNFIVICVNGEQETYIFWLYACSLKCSFYFSGIKTTYLPCLLRKTVDYRMACSEDMVYASIMKESDLILNLTMNRVDISKCKFLVLYM